MCGLNKKLEITSSIKYENYIKVTSRISFGEFLERIKSSNISYDDPNMVLKEDAAPMVDKYDYMVPKKLRKCAYLNNQMDLANAFQLLETIEKYRFISKVEQMRYLFNLF